MSLYKDKFVFERPVRVRLIKNEGIWHVFNVVSINGSKNNISLLLYFQVIIWVKPSRTSFFNYMIAVY